MKRIFTPQEIAQFLCVAPTTIYAELKRGKLPHSRVGRKYIITRQHLENYLSLEVVRELLDTEEQEDTVTSRKPIGTGRNSETVWMDAVADDMAKGIAAAEQEVPEEELSTWYKMMEAAVKPLEASDDRS